MESRRVGWGYRMTRGLIALLPAIAALVSFVTSPHVNAATLGGVGAHGLSAHEFFLPPKFRRGVRVALTNNAPASGDSMEGLIARARDGSSDALGAILERFRPYLLQVAYEELDANLRVKESPSDVVQKSFLEASAAFREFLGDAPDALQGWLRQILINNLRDVRDHYRTEKRQIGREVDGIDKVAGECLEAGTPPAEAIVREEQATALVKALARLDREDRQLIVWRHQEGRAFREIADILNITEDAARKRWARAIEGMRRLMHDELSPSTLLR